jgi:hypothetical protein
MSDVEEVDIIEEMERVDRFLDGTEQGDIPLDRLRASGMDIPDDDATLDDVQLHAKLREVFEALFDLGMVFDDTDHLSERELYRWLVLDVLRQETILSTTGTWHVSPIGGGSEEDLEIYLRYYANDEARQRWQAEFGGVLPAREPLPYQRDWYGGKMQ